MEFLIYILDQDNTWQEVPFSATDEENIFITCSLALADIVSSPNVICALLFRDYPTKAKPIGFAYEAIEKGGANIEPLQCEYADQGFKEITAEILDRIIYEELTLDMPKEIQGANLGFVICQEEDQKR